MTLSRSRKTQLDPRVEINIVPLVDVSLVLLIIFMVTATFIKAAGMNIQLPSSSESLAEKTTLHEVVIVVAADGTLFWQGEPITEQRLASVLKENAREFGTESHVIIQGDERAAYGNVVRAMSLAKQAGFTRLVISTRKEYEKNGPTH